MQVIPIYEAVKFERLMLGGSTYPWEVSVNTEDGLQTYVVKLYRRDEQHFDNPVRNDVLSNAIAKNFSLSIPDFAFVTFSDSFVETLDTEQVEQLKISDNRPKFATKLIKPTYPFSPALKERDLEVFDLETIYAFDNLILNVDRRVGKPNIFFSDSTYYLIDHEQTLHLQEGDNTVNTFLNRCSFNRHIFYRYLIKANKKGQLEGFNSFEELLRLINVDSIQPYIDDLDEVGYNIDTCFRVTNYLKNLKRNAHQFVNLIRDTVSNE